jgi:hypothetical protein
VDDAGNTIRGWSGQMNAMGVVKTRDAAAKPEAWIRFGTRERGYETGERKYGEYECGIDGESRGAPRDSRHLPKTTRRHPSNVHPRSQPTAPVKIPPIQAATT